MIFTGLCIMFLIRADTLLGQVGGGCALEMESFLGPVKWHQADRRVPFGAQHPPTCPCNVSACIKKHYAQGRINHRCIGGSMYKNPPWRDLRAHTSIPTCAYTYVSHGGRVGEGAVR